MEGIKYANLIEISSVLIGIRGVSKLGVPVLNNTRVRHTAFLAADTRPCVLIMPIISIISWPVPQLYEYCAYKPASHVKLTFTNTNVLNKQPARCNNVSYDIIRILWVKTISTCVLCSQAYNDHQVCYNT